MPNRDLEYTIPVDYSTLHIPFKIACRRTDNKRKYAISYQELADNTTVPLSNVQKFMAGLIKNPNILNLAEMANYINSQFDDPVISLDYLLGIAVKQASEHDYETDNKEILELKNEILSLRAEINHKDEIITLRKEYIERLEKGLSGRKYLIYSLLAILLVLAASFLLSVVL